MNEAFHRSAGAIRADADLGPDVGPDLAAIHRLTPTSPAGDGVMARQQKPLAVALMGPTASGKTAAALEIARQIPAEIISVDSALVYRDMKSAPPSRAPPNAPSAAPPDRYPRSGRSLFRHAIPPGCASLVAQITARGKLALLVGGTMLYFKALQQGLDACRKPTLPCAHGSSEAAAPAGRPCMRSCARSIRTPRRACNRTMPQRIQRALEIIELTGQPMSQLLAKAPPDELPFTLLPFALEPSDRSVLHAAHRSALRARCWTATDGHASEEVARLRARGDLHPGLPRCVASATGKPGNTWMAPMILPPCAKKA